MRTSRPRCAPAASPREVAASAQKFGKQIRYAERRGIPYVWFPAPSSNEVKDIRTGEQQPADPWTPPGRPATARQRRTVIRTHDAGSLRAEHAGQTVTLAGWVARRRDHGGVAFIDLREASGVVQVVVRDEAVAHQLRSEYCIKVTGEVGLRPEGNANPDLPTGEIEVVADRARGAQRRRAAAVPDRRPRRRGGGGAAQAPLPRPAP